MRNRVTQGLGRKSDPVKDAKEIKDTEKAAGGCVRV